jgi:sterol desaturase/sphingolipid hydroxylase (fatty acid hydroxylase superfamily)
MDWVPIALIIFKVLVFGTGMFFAIKWHYDQGKKRGPLEKRAVLRMAGKVALIAVIFVVLLVALLLGTFAFGRKLGLDLTFP